MDKMQGHLDRNMDDLSGQFGRYSHAIVCYIADSAQPLVASIEIGAIVAIDELRQRAINLFAQQAGGETYLDSLCYASDVQPRLDQLQQLGYVLLNRSEVKGYTIDGAPCCIACATLTNVPVQDKQPIRSRSEVYVAFPVKDAYPIKCLWCDGVIFPAVVG